jgi:GT2 family glycosyltransferase
VDRGAPGVKTPSCSVVVPVRDGAAFLSQSLPALAAALPADAELIVCDDGSRDASPRVAAAHGARVLSADAAAGPAAARNRGAQAATGDVLVFLDADVLVHADTVSRLRGVLDDPGVTAAFGSYDDAPADRSWPSLYKNLAHHFVHQRSRRDASTFWAGCGAVRREAFLAAGGFDTAYRRPSVEDVELGYRLRAAGHRIRLVPEAQVTHLKRWSLGGWLAADLRHRAVPWARLVRAGRGLPADLNFTLADRAASALVGLGLVLLAATPWRPALAGAGLAALAVSVSLDHAFLAFAARRVSPAFAAAAAGMHVLHRAAGLLGFAYGCLFPDRMAESNQRGLAGGRPRLEVNE